MPLDESAELIVQEVTDRVCEQLKCFRGIKIAGDIEVRVTMAEQREWDDLCQNSQQFRSLKARRLDLAVAHSKFDADPSDPDREIAFRKAVAARDDAFLAMREFASQWYDQLCARSPGIRQ